MAQPSTRQELIDYCLRKLGAPVLEINVAEEQVDDLVDDAVQFFQERHFDGVYPAFLKYQVTEDDIKRGKGEVGISTTTTTAAITGSSINFDYEENSNYIQVPPHVIGVKKIFQFEGDNSVSSGMFSVKYQLFLNDVYNFSSIELLTYSMVKTYLEDINFLTSTQKQIRFNKRQDRLYLDIDWNSINKNQYLIIDCYRMMDPSDYAKVWNDSFLKQYVTALIKKQWGQNLIKFQGVKLPGGTELNGRQLYDDGQREIDTLMDKMSSYYELPPLDMIG
nr:neck protein [uncultured Mediterranean phage uvMED]